jgi:cytochrome P450
LIAENQDVQLKLRSCLKEEYTSAVAEGRLPTASEIYKATIPYLDAVMEECLRLGNPIRLLQRQALVDTTVLGHHVPKGTTIFFSADGPGMKSQGIPIDNSEIPETSRAKRRVADWELEAINSFNPDRWLTEGDNHNVVFNANAGPFISFGLGPRGCFGKRLAYLEFRMVLVLLIWNFHFKELEGQLGSQEIAEGLGSIPKYCYVALEELK